MHAVPRQQLQGLCTSLADPWVAARAEAETNPREHFHATEFLPW
jgi:hypothetical protein